MGVTVLRRLITTSAFIFRVGLAVAAAAALPACFQQPRAAVNVHFTPAARDVRDAAVIIDEEYIGPFGYVARHGVRLPVGEHRITIEKDGYFPYDTIVVADREAIQLAVELVPIPD